MSIDVTDERHIYYSLGILRMIRNRVGLLSIDLFMKKDGLDQLTLYRVMKQTADLACFIDRVIERLTDKNEDRHLWVEAVDGLQCHDAVDFDDLNNAVKEHCEASGHWDPGYAKVISLLLQIGLPKANSTKDSPGKASQKRGPHRVPAPSSGSDDPSAA
jgi:hypothetical protein